MSRVWAIATLLLLMGGTIGSLGVAVPLPPIDREPAAIEENPVELGDLYPSPVTLPIETIWRSRYLDFGFVGPIYLVVQTGEEWRTLWNRVAQDPPAVDFETRTVLFAIYGGAPNSGHDLEIDTVTRGGGEVVSVVVRIDLAGSRCETLQVITHPLHIVSIPKSGLITFRTETAVHNCV